MKKILAILTCVFMFSLSFTNINAAGTINKSKACDVGTMSAQNYADKWAGYIEVMASTVVSGLVNKIYTYGSLKLNSTGAQIWSGSRTSTGNGAGENIKHSTTSYYGNKVAFYTTHDVIHTTSSTIYLVNTVN